MDHARSFSCIFDVVLATSVALVLFPVIASADDYHYENFRFGQQAMGMGGAVMALPQEPEATLYNPAGLVLSQGASFSGSLHFEGVDERTLVQGLQAPGSPSIDLASNGILVLPSSSVMSYSFGEDSTPQSVAFSSFLMSHTEEDFRGVLSPAPFVGNDNLEHRPQFSYARRAQDRIRFLGPSYAIRPAPALAFGLSIFVAQREQNTELDFSFRDPQRQSPTDPSPVRTVFFDNSLRANLSDTALLARLGVYYRPGNGNLHLGARVTTASVRLFGTGKISYGAIWSGDPQAQTEPFVRGDNAEELRSETRYPWEFALGAAWKGPWLTLSAEGSAHLPTSYKRLSLTPATADLLQGQFINQIERQLTFNARAGSEILLAPSWPLRLGFFTNTSAAPEIQQVPQAQMLPDIDLLGITASQGYRGERASLNMGATVEWGKGHDVIVEDISLGYRGASRLRIEREHFRVLFFISGAVNFLTQQVKSLGF